MVTQSTSAPFWAGDREEVGALLRDESLDVIRVPSIHVQQPYGAQQSVLEDRPVRVRRSDVEKLRTELGKPRRLGMHRATLRRRPSNAKAQRVHLNDAARVGP